jgi:uncharacterized coiled-coil protein SlyX
MNRFDDECVGCERLERALERELTEVQRLRHVEADQREEIDELHRRLTESDDRVDRAQELTFELIDKLADIRAQIALILARDKVLDAVRQLRQQTVEAGSWTP